MAWFFSEGGYKYQTDFPPGQLLAGTRMRLVPADIFGKGVHQAPSQWQQEASKRQAQK